MSETAYVAFGSNIGDGKKNIEDAAQALNLVPGITLEALSTVIETKPWGYEQQDNFCNACARLRVDISPEVLLGVCLGIEAAMGRVRMFTNGPRVIDIDVIMYGEEVRNTKELILPHPRMKERDFVLVPLYEIAENAIKSRINEMIEALEEKYVL